MTTRQSRPRVLFSWSGGKDSSLALHRLRQQDDVEIVALLTTVTEEYDRISMHGVRRTLLERQAAAIGLPLEIVMVPPGTDTVTYESRMRAMLEKHRAAGVESVVFGDIFLEDLRRYRIEKLAQVGMKALFPIWGGDTRDLARQFIRDGFKAYLTCVDGQALDGKFVGRAFDEILLAELPAKVDPCGENGEFHSFCWAGPIFNRPVRCRLGHTVVRESRFHFCDLVEAD